MRQKIKKIFSYLLKRKGVVLLFLIFLGMIYPLYSIQAVHIGDILKWVGGMAGPAAPAVTAAGYIIKWKMPAMEASLGQWVMSYIVMILQIPLFLANAFFFIAVGILGWVISPSFISISYTGMDNPVVRMGWELTRDLANMGIVLALVIIGLTTILRIESYQAKKTLPILIIIALLINFTPVILGVIIDASNILMNTFLENFAGFGKGFTKFSSQIEDIGKVWSQIASETKPEAPDWSPVGRTLALIAFGAIGGFVFLIIAALLLFRYIAIWMAVVLSPLAFVSLILPSTKKFFSMWWKQFISWCLIGVFAAFFLYLAGGLVELADKGELLTASPSEEAIGVMTGSEIEKERQAYKTLFDELLPYGVVIAFLGLSIIATISFGAMGADTIISLTKRGQKWAGKRTARGVGRFLEEKLRVREAAGKVTRAVEKAPVARWFLPEKFRQYGEFGEAIDQAQARAKTYSSQELGHRIANKASYGKEAAGELLQMLSRGDAEDIVDAYKKKYKDLRKASDEEVFKDKRFRKDMSRLIQISLQGGKLNKVLRSDPRFAAIAWEQEIGSYGDRSEIKTKGEAVRRATGEARSNHIANWEREVLEDKTIVKALMERGREVFENVDRNVKRGVETTLKTIDTIFSEFVDTELDASLANDVRQKKEGAAEKAWTKFHKHFKDEYKGSEGYFLALGSKRFTDRGFREGQYIQPSIRGKTPATPPGGAAMGPTPPSPPSGRRPGGTTPSGRRAGGSKSPSGRKP